MLLKMVQKFPKRDECRILYHITLKENLDSILDKGLIPDIGSQCTHCKMIIQLRS